MKEKQTILLKISGEFFKDNETIINNTKLIEIANQIKVLTKTYNIGVVIGGGNIIRGGTSTLKNVARTTADQMGMIATLINSLALRDQLRSMNVKVDLYSLIPIPTIARVYNINEMKNHLANNHVIIFAGGTGNPFFSTDSGIALRALETDAKTILMAKNGVDGVYSADPRKVKNAKRYDKLTYLQALKENLQVMDLTALSLLKDSGVTVQIFNADEDKCFIKALTNKIKSTKMTK